MGLHTGIKLFKTIHWLVGLLLVISIFSAYVDPVELPVISFIGLFFPVLWIGNLLFLIVFSILKNTQWLLAMALLMMSFYQLSLIFQASGNKQVKHAPELLGLVSYNTGNPDTLNPMMNRMEIFKQPAFNEAGIVCLQESTPLGYQEIPALRRFSNMVHIDFTGKAIPDQGGLTIYTNHEILEWDWLKQNNEDTYVLWANMVIAGDTIRLINVQLQSIRLDEHEIKPMIPLKDAILWLFQLGDTYAKIRRAYVWKDEQIDELKNLITNSPYEVILCGDFNDPPSSYTYRTLSGLLKDTFVERGNGVGFTYAGGIPFLRIDYVMVDQSIAVISHHHLTKTHSDHYPVVVRLGWGNWPASLHTAGN